MKRRMKEDEKYKNEVEAQMQKSYVQKMKKRQERVVPVGDPVGMIDFLLSSAAEEMGFEVARCRPQLNDIFFTTLDTEIGKAKFGVDQDEDRLAELEGLKQYIMMAIESLDAQVKTLASPVERMTKLLTAKDKKAAITEMANNGEIDAPLIALLDQNIVAAERAEQTEAAEFMKKVRNAANRFLIATPDAATLKTQFQADMEEADKFFEEAALEAERLDKESNGGIADMKRDASGAVLLEKPGGGPKETDSGLIL